MSSINSGLGVSPLYPNFQVPNVANNLSFPDLTDVVNTTISTLIFNPSIISEKEASEALSLFSKLRISSPDLFLGVLQRVNEVNQSDKLTPLTRVISLTKKRPDLISLLHSLGASFEISDAKGDTPLTLAVKKLDFRKDSLKDSFLFFESLKNLGANFNFFDANGLSPLMLAIELATTEETKQDIDKESYEKVMLCCNMGADINIRNNEGKNALDLAVEKGSHSLFSLLSKYGINIQENNTLISKIIKQNSDYPQNDLATISILVKVGFEINRYDENDETPLLTAIKFNKELVGGLISLCGANPNQCDYEGNTPLTTAVDLLCGESINSDIEDVKEIIDLLLDLGASVNLSNKYLPIVSAALYGNLDIMRQLIKRGADINQACVGGKTALTSVISSRKLKPEEQLKLVEELISLGADPTRCDNLNNTPLIIAARIADDVSPAIVKFLLDLKIDPDQVDGYSRTALMVALQKNKKRVGTKDEIVKILMENGANPKFTKGIIESSFLGNVWEIAGSVITKTTSVFSESIGNIEGSRINEIEKKSKETISTSQPILYEGAIDITDINKRFGNYVTKFVSNLKNLDEKQKTILSNAFIQAYPHPASEFNLKEISEGTPLIISSGPYDHAVNFVAIKIHSKSFVCMCNRGPKTRENEAEIEVYETEIDINLIRTLGSAQTKEIFRDNVTTLLPLKNLRFSLRLKNQIIGNCPIASNEAAFYALFYMMHLPNLKEKEDAEMIKMLQINTEILIKLQTEMEELQKLQIEGEILEKLQTSIERLKMLLAGVKIPRLEIDAKTLEKTNETYREFIRFLKSESLKDYLKKCGEGEINRDETLLARINGFQQFL